MNEKRSDKAKNKKSSFWSFLKPQFSNLSNNVLDAEELTGADFDVFDLAIIM
jgi:hypothetical protein